VHWFWRTGALRKDKSVKLGQIGCKKKASPTWDPDERKSGKRGLTVNRDATQAYNQPATLRRGGKGEKPDCSRWNQETLTEGK